MTDRIKLLCFVSDLDGGGAQRTMVNLVNAFTAMGEFDVQFAVGRGNGPGAGWLDRSVELSDFGVAHTRSTLVPMRRLVRAFRPDVVFSSMLDANIVAGAACVGVKPRPRLITRETNSHRARGDLSWPRRLAARWTCRRADRVIALSSGVGDELRADYGLMPDHVVTIHNPIDVETLAGRAADTRTQTSPFRQDGPTVVAAGRLTRQKGFDLLIEAIAGLHRSSVQLAILGDGPDRRALENLAAQRGVGDRVHLPGFSAEPERWMAHADLFVLSSRWEGFGHVIAEAMACGTPVIAFDCPHGPRDIITHDGDGILVPNGDVAALTRSIDDLLSDPDRRRRLADQARANVGRFRIDHIAGRYRDLIRSVAGRHRVAQG